MWIFTLWGRVNSSRQDFLSQFVDFLFIVTPIVGVCNCSMFCCALLNVHSSIAIILMGKRELVALLNLSTLCLVMVERLFLAVPQGCLRFVIVVFPDHTHLLFLCLLFTDNFVSQVTDDLLFLNKWKSEKIHERMCGMQVSILGLLATDPAAVPDGLLSCSEKLVL